MNVDIIIGDIFEGFGFDCYVLMVFIGVVLLECFGLCDDVLIEVSLFCIIIYLGSEYIIM